MTVYQVLHFFNVKNFFFNKKRLQIDWSRRGHLNDMHNRTITGAR